MSFEMENLLTNVGLVRVELDSDVRFWIWNLWMKKLGGWF